MKYNVTINYANGEQETRHISADSAKHAHESVRATITDENAVVRVYAQTQNADGTPNTDGIQKAALSITKRTTANMFSVTSESGTKLQERLYKGCRVKIIVDEDVTDCIQSATMGILEAMANGEDIQEQYKSGYRALYNHLYSMNAVKSAGRETLYIEDIDGELVNVYGEMNRIIKQGEKYTAPLYDDWKEPTEEEREALAHIIERLTPTQKKVLYLTARGLSQCQIGEQLRISQQAVSKHIKRMREIALALYPQGRADI